MNHRAAIIGHSSRTLSHRLIVWAKTLLVATGVMLNGASALAQTAPSSFDPNRLRIVMIPDDFYPVIWYDAQKYGADFTLGSVYDTGVYACSTFCPQAAEDAGAVYYKQFDVSGRGTVTVYYDQSANIVGTSPPEDSGVSLPQPQLQQAASYKSARRYTVGGQLTGEIQPDPGNGHFPATRYTYNSQGLLIKTEYGALSQWQDQNIAPADWSGFTVSTETLITYDDQGRKISEGTATADGTLKTLTQYSYDAYDRLICTAVRMSPPFTTEPTGSNAACTPGSSGSTYGPDRITTTTYDELNRVTQISKAVGTSLEQDYVTYHYTEDGLPKDQTDANGNRTEFAYDGFDRLVDQYFPSETIIPGAASGSITSSQYLITYSSGGSVVSYAWTGTNTVSVTWSASASTAKVVITYGTSTANNAPYETRTYSAVVSKGQSISWGSQPGSPGGPGWTSSPVPGGIGSIQSISVYGQDSSGNYTVLVAGSQYSGTAHSADYEAYTYDNNGNRTSLRKRDGRIINYHYDALNRMTEKDLPNTSSGDVYYGYNLQGLQTYAHFGSPSGSGVTTAYDGFGEVRSQTSQVGGTARTVSHQYDADGNLTRVTYPDGAAFSYVYNGLDQLTYLQEAASGDVLAQYAYDSYARPTTRTTPGNATATVSYDGVSRLATIGDQFASSGDNLTRSFTYNPASQISTQTLSNTAYRYAEAGDQGGTYVANSLNQYTRINGVSIGHDANGNLTAYGSATQYSYDVENRLISVSGAHSATLSYDPNGRLSEAGIDGSTTDFLYDGDALIGEYQGGSLSKRYVYAKRTDTPVVSYTGGGLGSANRQFLYTDHQGSVIAAVDNNGTVQSINTYNAYGVPGNANQGRFGYTGQASLAPLGLDYYRARMYDPKIGRFMQTDPIGYEDQMNLYAYVHNDPVTNVDPTGEASKVAWLIRLGSSSMKKIVRLTKEQAVRARAQEQNVFADSRQMARQIETSAHGEKNLIKHKGHDLPEGTKGRPHFQTEGVKGHTFWSMVAAALLGGAEVLDKIADLSEVVDPTTYITSGDRYLDSNGNVVSFEELAKQRLENSTNSQNRSNSDSGMSGETVRICSGMGAEKGGCQS